MGAALLLTLICGGEPATALSACSDACYQAKSVDYQRCRSIPPGNRTARAACFQRADTALQRCLRQCR